MSRGKKFLFRIKRVVNKYRFKTGQAKKNRRRHTMMVCALVDRRDATRKRTRGVVPYMGWDTW